MKYLLHYVFVSYAAATCSLPLPQVTTLNGMVEGYCIIDTPMEVNAFLGIPFATPPTGSLRLEKPQPVENWAGVLNTKTQPPRCIQTPTSDPNSEDCLYLNVIAPANATGLPVVVVIHGGAFLGGGARQHGDIGIAKNLASKGVVVVVIQYRLGLLGFGSFGDSVLPGNLGLFDMKLALEWVQDNIEFFGGNPDSVTLNGGSAGGAAIDCLSISPLTYNLFHKAWAFSGSCREMYTSIVNNTFQRASARGFTWTTTADLTAQLKATPNLTGLLTRWAIIKEDNFKVYNGEYGPIFDGDFFPIDNNSALRAAAPIKPRVHGVTFHEGAMLAGAITITNSTLGDLLDVSIPTGTTDREYIIAHLRTQYEARAAILEPADPVKHAFQAAFGERIIISSSKDVLDRLVELHGSSQDAYLYVLKYFTPAAYGALYPYVSYASHGLENNYMLAMGTYTYDSNDMIMVEMMTSAVSNFAKTGNPNTPLALPITWEKKTT